MYGYIYRITDLTNGKCYIGQRKWNKPGIDLNYWGSGTIISNIVQKRKKEDRMDTLLREKLMDCATLEELNYFETYFIEHMNTLDPFGYNLNTGGDVRKASDATRSKLRTIRKGKTNSGQFKKGCIPWDKNKKRPEISGEKHPKYVKICPLLLYKYRIVDGLSFSKIGKLFNVNRVTIINKCKKIQNL